MLDTLRPLTAGRLIVVFGAPGARGGDTLLLHPDRRAAIHAAVRAARPGDTVLLAGKGHERSITTGTTRLPWDDEAEARGPHISVTTPLCSTMAAVVSPTHL